LTGLGGRNDAHMIECLLHMIGAAVGVICDVVVVGGSTIDGAGRKE